MPSWKKVITSGSDAALNSLLVTTSVTASIFSGSYTGSLFGTASFSTRAASASGLTSEGLSVINSGQVYVPLIVGSPSTFNRFSYSSPLRYNAFSDNLTTTSSWATSSMSASYVTGSVYNSSNPALSASYAQSSSFTITSSFTSTASFVNPLYQNVLISGSLTVGLNSLGSEENTLVLGPKGPQEGGQLLLYPGTSYTSASMLDVYQDSTNPYFRILRGSVASSDALVAQFNLHTKQLLLPAYNSTTAFTSTPLVGLLGFDSNGAIITTTTSSGGGGGGVTITNNTDNYILTATGVANSINGESNLQFNGSTLSVTGNVTATSVTSSNAVIAQANNAMYFRGGDDAELWDINIANTLGVYGQQNQTVASIKLGSSGGTISGKSGNIGIGTINPGATLHIEGNVSASSYTGSLLGTASYVTGSIHTSLNPALSASYALSSSYAVSSSYTLNADLLDGIHGSVFITTGSSVSVQSITGSLVLSGSTTTELRVIGETQMTGSLMISNGLVAQTVTGSFTGSLTGSVFGTASWANNALTASALTLLSQSVVTINTAQSSRFPGFVVYDSGSAGVSSSLLFDSVNNNWLFIHSQTAAATLTSSLLIMAPETYNNVGNETKLSLNRIPKSQGDEHIADSNIFDNGTVVQITGSNIIISGSSTAFVITGSVSSFGGFTGSLLGTSSWANNVVTAQTASYLNQLKQNVTISGSLFITASTSNNALLTQGDLIISGTVYATASYSDLAFRGVGNTQFTGSVGSIGGFTGSLLGTSSWAVSASWAPGGSSSPAFPYNGTAIITGSIIQQTGSAFFPTLNASESLSAGDFINISASFVRRASSTDTTKQCHGFVIAAVSSGSAATIYYNGINPVLSGLTVGARYFLSASGAESVSAPTTTGQLSQELGVAVSTTSMLINIGPAIIT